MSGQHSPVMDVDLKQTLKGKFPTTGPQTARLTNHEHGKP